MYVSLNWLVQCTMYIVWTPNTPNNSLHIRDKDLPLERLFWGSFSGAPLWGSFFIWGSFYGAQLWGAFMGLLFWGSFYRAPVITLPKSPISHFTLRFLLGDVATFSLAFFAFFAKVVFALLTPPLCPASP